MQFVFDRGAREERPARSDFVEDASDAPHVDGGGVLGGAQQHVGRAVPQGDHLVRIRLRRDGLSAGQAEIGQL